MKPVFPYLYPGALAVAALAAGCSGSPYDARVSGVVRLDGAEIGPGVVIFAPMEESRNPAKGAIDPKGRFDLRTKHASGLPPGEYRVAVQVFDTSNAPALGERQQELPKALVPEKYLSVETSGLAYTVKAGRNTIDVELASD